MSKHKVEVFFINLDRRADRRASIEARLRDSNIFEVTRIVAVDGKNETLGLDDRVVSRGQAACWKSHQKVFETFLRGDGQFAVILEDDAVFHPSALNPTSIQKWIDVSKEFELSCLQLGWVEEAYPTWGKGNLLSTAIAISAGKRRRSRIVKETVYLDEFRAGTHAYLVDRNLAEHLVCANTPPLFAADDFFIAFAAVANKNKSLRFGRLGVSRVSQETRNNSRFTVDSDID